MCYTFIVVCMGDGTVGTGWNEGEGNMARIVEEGYRNFIRHTGSEPAYRQYRMDYHGSMPRGCEYNDFLAVTMGPRSYVIEAELKMEPPCAMLIGKYCSIADDVLFLVNNDCDYAATSTYPLHLLDTSMPGEYREGEASHSGKRQIIIGNDVRIGTRATICAGVRIGNGAIVMAGAVVTTDVPPYAIVEGNPAKVINYRFDEETIQYLQKIKWWHWSETEIVKHKDFMLDPSRREKDLPSIKVQVSEELAKSLNGLREGGKLFGVLVDSEPYLHGGEPLYRHVMERFQESAGAGDVLFLAAVPEYQEEGQKALAYLSEKDISNIRLLNMGSAFNYTILACLDYFLAGRQEADVIYVDYAEDAGTGVLMGANRNPFVGMGGAVALAVPVANTEENAQKKPYQDDIEVKKAALVKYIAEKKDEIRARIATGQHEEAMKLMLSLANILYEYNQTYTDDELEGALKEIAQSMGGAVRWQQSEENTVLFYDGFGLDTRGLAAIYLDALVSLPYRVIYLVTENAKGKIPTLEAILQGKNAHVAYYPDDSYIEAHRHICEVIDKFRPKHGFLYTTPWDIAGLSAFMRYEGSMKRYQINLTDHAFWLGVNAFDYCLEFRDYGARISNHYRKIPAEKLIRLEYYPYVGKKVPFAGYPFEKQPGDFVIFSGGSLYKTMNEKRTYYKVVDHVLASHPQVRFWYAGHGDDSELVKLKEKYPQRVFHTQERKDILSIMENVDLYLGTYPMNGGLMLQYSVIGRCVPLSLRHNEDASGILINQDELGVEFSTAEEWIDAINRFIDDETYRKELRRNIATAVITRDEFVAKVNRVMINPSNNILDLSPIDTKEFRSDYVWRFLNKYCRK